MTHVQKLLYTANFVASATTTLQQETTHSQSQEGKEGKPATDVMWKWGKGPRTWKNATKNHPSTGASNSRVYQHLKGSTISNPQDPCRVDIFAYMYHKNQPNVPSRSLTVRP